MIEPTTKALEALSTPPNNLKEFCDNNKQFLADIERELNWLTQVSARYGEYIGMRHGGGCGDQGDKDAWIVADKTVKKVRAAIGYSYP